MQHLPLVSIITPSYNQNKFIRENIKSVMFQDYPNIEHIVVDGGSTDGTITTLKEHESTVRRGEVVKKRRGNMSRITHHASRNFSFKWISEKDNGQADAINKGIRMAKGEIIGYLNSDDWYLPGTIRHVVELFSNNPKSIWITGDADIVDEYEKKIWDPIRIYKKFMRKWDRKLAVTNSIVQPSTFWRASVNKKLGAFDTSLTYAFDYDFWLRICAISLPIVTARKLSSFRIHRQSKGSQEYANQFYEDLRVVRRYENNPVVLQLHKIHNYIISIVYSCIKRP